MSRTARSTFTRGLLSRRHQLVKTASPISAANSQSGSSRRTDGNVATAVAAAAAVPRCHAQLTGL